MRSSTIAAGLAALLGLLLTPATAVADRQAAGRLFRAGQEAADNREFATAIRAFEASYAAEPHPNTRFALAQAHRQQYALDQKLEHVRQAIDLLRRFLEEAPRSPWRKSAEAQLLELLAIVARQPAQAPATSQPAPAPPTEIVITSRTPGARIYIDGEPQGQRSPAIRAVSAGDHQIRVEAAGYTSERRIIRAVERRLITAEVELEPLPGTVRVVADQSGSQVYLDGRAVGATPLLHPAVRPGEHKIAVASRGHRLWTGSLAVEPERTALAVASLEWTGQRRAAWLTAAGGVAAALAGVVTGVLALQADSSLGSMSLTSEAERRDHDAALYRRDTLASSSTALFITAGVALAVGAALYWFDLPSPPALEVRR